MTRIIAIAVLGLIGVARASFASSFVLSPLIGNVGNGISPAEPTANAANTVDDVLIGTIPGLVGFVIDVTRIGIGGDSDGGSGPNAFRLIGGGVDFSWVTGQGAEANVPSTFYLATIPNAPGAPDSRGRGFSFAGVDFTTDLGASLSLFWTFHADYDNYYTYGSDALGNSYDDSAVFGGSLRPWVQYEYVGEATAVPEPGSLTLVGLGVISVTRAVLRRRSGRRG